MDKVEVGVRNDIMDMIHLFYALVDQGKASQTAGIFSSDAQLTFGPGSPQPGTIIGAAIRGAMEARERQTSAFTRHAVTNIILTRATDTSVTAQYLLILFRSDDDSRGSVPAFVADVAEVWTLQDNGWRLAEREIRPQFSRS